MPNKYTHMHGNVERTHHASHDTLKEIKTTMKKQLHHGTLRDKLRIGTLAGRLSQVPDTAMETCLAADGINLATRAEMYSRNMANAKNIMSFDRLTNILPCITTINDYCIESAAHKVIFVGMLWPNLTESTSYLTKVPVFYVKNHIFGINRTIV